jgi:hypothetical protein
VSVTAAVKIGVIADTHLEAPSPELERLAEGLFRDADLVVHAGDIRSEAVLGVFSGKELVAVRGNNDAGPFGERLPEQAVFEAAGHRIGVIHGRGWPFGLPGRVGGRFRDVDCIVFGHSHRPCNERRGGVLLFNPGAFRGGLFSLWRRSVGILRAGREVQGEIVRL